MSIASQNHYRRVHSAHGKAIRAFFSQALRDADQLPGRRALQGMAAELAEQVPGLSAEALAKQFTAYAEKAQRQDGHAGHRFALRGQVDQLAGALVGKLEDADRIVPVAENTDEDLDAAVAQASESATPDSDAEVREATAKAIAAEQRQADIRRAARS